MDKYNQKALNRFSNLLEKTNTCWNWKSTISKRGYGKFFYKNKQMLAHRFSYMIFNGELKHGMYVCHKCDNTKCVNPEHLFLGTNSDNVRDCVKKNRKYVKKIKNTIFSIKFGRNDFCKNGHDIKNDKNVYTLKNGRQYCKICQNAANKRSREKWNGLKR